MVSEAVALAVERLEQRAHGRVVRDAPLAPLTSYRLGGPAAVLLEAASEDDLAALADALRETELPLLVVGRGSNMLIADGGFGGIAVRLGSGFRWSQVDGSVLRAGAAMPLPSLAMQAQQHRLTRMEFTVAIPASLGGAVTMNAGAHGHELAEIVEAIDLFDLTAGERERIAGEHAGFAYRRSSLPQGSIVTGATLALEPGEPAAIARAMDEAKEWRRTTQPVNLPNGGSVFKNPPGDHAARLIEMHCGKGIRVGGARISEVHANFIVAEPGARASDVYALLRSIQRTVRERAGIQLEPELKLIGTFEEGDA